VRSTYGCPHVQLRFHVIRRLPARYRVHVYTTQLPVRCTTLPRAHRPISRTMNPPRHVLSEMVAHSLERVIREPSLGCPGDGRLLRSHQIVSHPMNPLPREPYPQFPARMTRFGSLATQLPVPLELACAHSPCSCPRREVVSAHSPHSYPRDELRATLLTVQSPAR